VQETPQAYEEPAPSQEEDFDLAPVPPDEVHEFPDEQEVVQPEDHLDGLPGLDSGPPMPPPDDEAAAGLDEDGTLLKWEGHGEDATPEAMAPAPGEGPGPLSEGTPPPFIVDESPQPAFEPEPPPPSPAFEEESPSPAAEPQSPFPDRPREEETGYKPWDRPSEDEEEEEDDVLEEMTIAKQRRDAEPLGLEEKKRARQLLSGRGYGRIRGPLLGFLMLLLPFFPLVAKQGNVKFFWDFMDQGIFSTVVFPFLGAGALGFLLILTVIFRSGVIRGFLQMLFAGAYLGVLAFVVGDGTLTWYKDLKLDIPALFQNWMLAVMVGAFCFTIIGSRMKIYHPANILPRLMCFLGGAGIIAMIFIPPESVGLTGKSFFDFLLAAFKLPKVPVFAVVNLALLALIALVGVTNILSFRSGIRSRLALLFGWYLLLYPLVDFMVTVLEASIGDEMVLFVHLIRAYCIVFLAVWVLFVGLSSFLGNLLVTLNYNDQMLLARS
jgi:hypothetical protein